MLDYKLLEALACVILEQGFDKASRRLCITQSAVSQRVKLLEDQAGQVLVTRTMPPRPTPAGQRLLKHYMQVKTLEADLERQVEKKRNSKFKILSAGINADSLATWFFPAVSPFLKCHKVLLDLKVDDQDKTHKMLRNGEVSGCISSQSTPVQGCRATYIGTMTYRLAATPEFAGIYFSKNRDMENFKAAPAVIFNRRDDLHDQFFNMFFKTPMPEIPIHYVPSSEIFADMIINGAAYGMIPDLQALDHILAGRLTDLAPDCHIRVRLYWHRWNLSSQLLDDFSKIMVKNAVIY
ncbi:MAG: LysR family transcriptional regulator ArgP [Deltaproteobacteria bacterium]|nr:LysR family transcriptional regulator ArgP [Deltaproteobacteria bacterium]